MGSYHFEECTFSRHETIKNVLELRTINRLPTEIVDRIIGVLAPAKKLHMLAHWWLYIFKRFHYSIFWTFRGSFKLFCKFIFIPSIFSQFFIFSNCSSIGSRWLWIVQFLKFLWTSLYIYYYYTPVSCWILRKNIFN